MHYNKYEMDLLMEAIAVALSKDKRLRGTCDRLEMIAPIRDNTPDYFKDTMGDLKIVKK